MKPFSITLQSVGVLLSHLLSPLLSFTSSSSLLFFFSIMANQGSLYPTLNWREFIERTRNVEGCVVLAMELGLILSENECSTCHWNMVE